MLSRKIIFSSSPAKRSLPPGSISSTIVPRFVSNESPLKYHGNLPPKIIVVSLEKIIDSSSLVFVLLPHAALDLLFSKLRINGQPCPKEVKILYLFNLLLLTNSELIV